MIILFIIPGKLFQTHSGWQIYVVQMSGSRTTVSGVGAGALVPCDDMESLEIRCKFLKVL